MTKRTVKVTYSGEFTYDIDDISDDFEVYYGTSNVEDVDIETVRKEDGSLQYLIEEMLNNTAELKFELNWADDVQAD